MRPPNDPKLNADKCKGMNIDFKNKKHAFEPVVVDGKKLSVVSSVKILGVTLSSGLTWSHHVNEAIRKPIRDYTSWFFSSEWERALVTFIALLSDQFSNIFTYFSSCFARVSYPGYRASTAGGAKNYFT